VSEINCVSQLCIYTSAPKLPLQADDKITDTYNHSESKPTLLPLNCVNFKAVGKDKIICFPLIRPSLYGMLTRSVYFIALHFIVPNCRTLSSTSLVLQQNRISSLRETVIHANNEYN
jgi:hypothetical protein